MLVYVYVVLRIVTVIAAEKAVRERRRYAIHASVVSVQLRFSIVRQICLIHHTLSFRFSYSIILRYWDTSTYLQQQRHLLCSYRIHKK